MPAQTHVFRAWKSIREMPLDYWIDVKLIAKSAGLSVHSMSRFLTRAKAAGIVDHKEVRHNSACYYLWRRSQKCSADQGRSGQ